MEVLLNICIWLLCGFLAMFLFKKKYGATTIEGDESLLVLFGPYSLLFYVMVLIYGKFRR